MALVGPSGYLVLRTTTPLYCYVSSGIIASHHCHRAGSVPLQRPTELGWLHHVPHNCVPMLIIYSRNSYFLSSAPELEHPSYRWPLPSHHDD